MKLIILLLFMFSCGVDVADPFDRYKVSRKVGLHKLSSSQQTIDSAFLEYVREFEREVGPVTFSVSFSDDLDYEDLGMCRVKPLKGLKYVLINTSGWQEMTHAARWVLMFHELFHCSAEFSGHFDGEDIYGCPMSIMYPSIATDDYYCTNRIFKNKKAYIEQLLALKKGETSP